MDTEKHRSFTGVGNELILSNLKKLSRRGSRIQLRLPFIPGFTADIKNLNAIADLASTLAGITGISILPYHKAAAEKHKRYAFNYRLGDVQEPTEAELLYAQELFNKKGLAAVISGR